eukprot:CAMPEP_0174260610 /NCGR_PEP_ID=MMETSP0439-20130205/10062_1 /TAXON_ID=0 /ORGANISM="Stereomyxa ramosa, Strain Chinc5" /LENGTH=447 /DNA_ID=CAMNT_0015344889 /DNA_START=219 /DNA_END=1562 /DNA_ORIENTATION=-
MREDDEDWDMQESTKLSADQYLTALYVNISSASEDLNSKTVENYTLSVEYPVATLHAENCFGALRGLETFSQLITETAGTFAINQTTVTDFPRFSFRGVMIDTARHYLSVEVIKRFLEAMSYSKFNVLHWHLVDDQSFPYESLALPNLIEGAYTPKHVYSQDTVKSIVEYAKYYGIRVVPEFDTPGHTASWGVGYPDLLTPCYQNGKPDGMRYGVNPVSSNSFQFMTTFWNEVASVFTDDYVHAGGDEVSFGCWKSNPDIQAFMVKHKYTIEQVEQYYENNLLSIIGKTGKSYVVWQEIFDNGVKVLPNTVLNVWKGGNYQAEIAKITAAGYRALLSAPWYLNYISYGKDWPKYYQADPQNFTGTPAQKELVVGGEACLWGEYIDSTNLISRAWPRACAVGERLWSQSTVTDVDDATTRLHVHRCRLLRRGIAAEPASGPSYCDTIW